MAMRGTSALCMAAWKPQTRAVVSPRSLAVCDTLEGAFTGPTVGGLEPWFITHNDPGGTTFLPTVTGFSTTDIVTSRSRYRNVIMLLDPLCRTTSEITPSQVTLVAQSSTVPLRVTVLTSVVGTSSTDLSRISFTSTLNA